MIDENNNKDNQPIYLKECNDIVKGLRCNEDDPKALLLFEYIVIAVVMVLFLEMMYKSFHILGSISWVRYYMFGILIVVLAYKSNIMEVIEEWNKKQ